jgi:F-type H+-transporting ATPase subunit O
MFSRQALLRSARAAAPQRAILGQTRAFAAAAPSSTERVQPPVALFGIDGTYATALVRPPPDGPIGLR